MSHRVYDPELIRQIKEIVEKSKSEQVSINEKINLYCQATNLPVEKMKDKMVSYRYQMESADNRDEMLEQIYKLLPDHFQSDLEKAREEIEKGS